MEVFKKCIFVIFILYIMCFLKTTLGYNFFPINFTVLTSLWGIQEYFSIFYIDHGACTFRNDINFCFSNGTVYIFGYLNRFFYYKYNVFLVNKVLKLKKLYEIISFHTKKFFWATQSTPHGTISIVTNTVKIPKSCSLLIYI